MWNEKLRLCQTTAGGPFPGIHAGDGYGAGEEWDRPSSTARLPANGPGTTRPAPAPRRVNLLIDIQERMRQGKGPAYERWAKVYNLKQMAAALQYLKEHQLFEYDDMAAKTDAATERFHTLAGGHSADRGRAFPWSDLMAAVVQYAKIYRPAFDGYKADNGGEYSRKYLAEHEVELADYRAAKATMAELLGGEKLPKMDVLKKNAANWQRGKSSLFGIPQGPAGYAGAGGGQGGSAACSATGKG